MPDVTLYMIVLWCLALCCEFCVAPFILIFNHEIWQYPGNCFFGTRKQHFSALSSKFLSKEHTPSPPKKLDNAFIACYMHTPLRARTETVPHLKLFSQDSIVYTLNVAFETTPCTLGHWLKQIKLTIYWKHHHLRFQCVDWSHLCV